MRFDGVGERVDDPGAEDPAISTDGHLVRQLAFQGKSSRFREDLRVFHQFADQPNEIEPRLFEREAAIVGTREQEERIDDEGEPGTLLAQILEELARFGRERGRFERVLHLSPHERERRFQFVRRVGGKTRDLLEAPLQAIEHRVQDQREITDLILRRGVRQALAQIGRRDVRGPRRNGRDRRNRPVCDPPAAGADGDDHERKDEEVGTPQARERFFDMVEILATA